MEPLVLNEIENAIFEQAKPYLDVMNNEFHTRTVIQFVLELLPTTDGDRDITVTAAILHDVGWSQVPEDIVMKSRVPRGDMELLKIHEDKGAVIARRILENVNYPPDRIASIIAIVLGHDSRRQPLDINDKIVKDADQLSRFSPYLWFMLDRVGMTAPEICDALETRIPSWFHLPLSLQLAQRELALRRQEIAEQSN
jgi:HD superfamily phosphohydrolase YqeK